MKDFSTLNISPEVLQNIQFLGFSDMTLIQEMVVPTALNGEDIIGQAKTGTGKTLAFAIPVIERIPYDSRHTQALILTPTRELALQVGLEFEKLAGSNVRIAFAYGGASINQQIEQLNKGVHVVVGTPGRVIDHIKRRTLNLDHVQTVVLDEADRMLDMGFIKDVEWILNKTPKKRQTMLFSATIPNEIRRLGEKHMHHPQYITATQDSDELTVDDIQQYYVEVDQKAKMDAFFHVLKSEHPSKALIFCMTKRWVEKLYEIMKRKRLSVERLHGDLTQAGREKAVERLKTGKITYLVCTDVAARGLDINDISHVFNYDIPREPLTYVHRIGRTARIGKKGIAITFVNPGEIRSLWLIEHEARTKIEQKQLK
ncbi:MAG: DEAD/DEAH box helicase [Candidatus Altiarchaeota archaeon]